MRRPATVDRQGGPGDGARRVGSEEQGERPDLVHAGETLVRLLSEQNVTVHVLYVNKVKPSRNFEADVTRNYPFAASLSLPQAETQLAEQLINNLADEIFNRIFSDW